MAEVSIASGFHPGVTFTILHYIPPVTLFAYNDGSRKHLIIFRLFTTREIGNDRACYGRRLLKQRRTEMPRPGDRSPTPMYERGRNDDLVADWTNDA